jgi:pimeloyl-ACP methyl ester carboxylesterase
MAADAAGTPATRAAEREGSGHVDVGGRRLFACWAGSGTPAVVLEADLGQDHSSWQPLLEGIAAVTRVVAYDRAGMGRSDAHPSKEVPWTGRDAAVDLLWLARRLQRQVEMHGPYVLVGRGFGGQIVQLFADRWPGAVAGLVLVEGNGSQGGEAIDVKTTRVQLSTTRPLRTQPVRVEDRPDRVVEAVRRVVEDARRDKSSRVPATRSVACLIPHPSELRVLVVQREAGQGKEGRGGTEQKDVWELPHVEIPNWWIADALGRVSAQVQERLGLRAIVLRHLAEGASVVCELEARDPAWQPPEGSRWASLDDARAAGLAAPEAAGAWEHAAALERWFGEQAGTVVIPAIRPAWEYRRWYDGAVAWVDQQIARLGAERTEDALQRKGAWPGSCVLRIPTSQGDFYLKAVYSRSPGEPALVAALAERWPALVPEIVALDTAPERRWMLMRDFGRGWLRRKPMVCWEEAARQFASLQIEAAAELECWLAMGCEDRRASTLPAHLDRLLADVSALGLDKPWGLSRDELEQVQVRLPRLRDLCEELAASGVPDSLVQQDFRDGNVAVVQDPKTAGQTGERCRFVFYDWSDAVVGHPFFCGIRMQDYINQPYQTAVRGPAGLAQPVTFAPAAHRRYVRDAYLEPFTRFAPVADLRRSFQVARTLNPLWQTIRWWLERQYYEDTSPWAASAATWAPDGLREVLRWCH